MRVYHSPEKFTIDGTYSGKTNRIGLTKTYKLGTGNPSENLGHQVTIQVSWNEENQQFEGIWFLKKSQLLDENKFELKFIEQLQPLEFVDDNTEPFPLNIEL